MSVASLPNAVAIAFPDTRRAAVRHQHRRHFPESQERHHPADGDRADAARGEPELHRLLALHERHFRAGVRVFHSDGGGGRVGHRLAILVVLFRNLNTINVDDLNALKG